MKQIHVPQTSLFQPGEQNSSVCQFALKATINQARGDYTDIKMTKTRRQAGDSGAAQDMCGKQECGAYLKTFKDKNQSQIVQMRKS